MARFQPLIVKNIIQETADCISVGFDIPQDQSAHFQYTQGQFLTFSKEIDGEEVRRSYSICSSPLEAGIRIAIKIIPGGKFSTYAASRLQVGESIGAMAPAGRFHTPLDSKNQKMYLAIAAGSGITPVISLVKTILATEPMSRVCLLYGNKTRSSIIFRSSLEDLKNRYMKRFSLYHILSREHSEVDFLHGRVDRPRLRFFLDHFLSPSGIDEVFICGPEAMMKEAASELTLAGVEGNHIHFELFSTAGPGTRLVQPEVPGETDSESRVKIQIDGKQLEVDMLYHGESILEAALRSGADVPYACKGGVCTTCRALLEKGEAVMDVNYGLEPDEIKAGFILTCQAHPRSKEIAVNFDVK